MKKEVIVFGLLAFIILVLLFSVYNNITGEYYITKELRQGDLLLTFEDVGVLGYNLNQRPNATYVISRQEGRIISPDFKYEIYRSEFDIGRY